MKTITFIFAWLGTMSLCRADQRPGCASTNPYNVLLSKNNDSHYTCSFLIGFSLIFIFLGFFRGGLWVLVCFVLFCFILFLLGEGVGGSINFLMGSRIAIF